jgi:hypothetical protein
MSKLSLRGSLLTRIPTIDDVLDQHATALGNDSLGYRNHVYRTVNLCAPIAGRSELEKIAVSAVYLVACACEDWTDQVEQMIANHRRLVTLILNRIRSIADADANG